MNNSDSFNPNKNKKYKSTSVDFYKKLHKNI